jgi:hypothetical protein
MTAGIVCVEWTEPVSVRWLLTNPWAGHRVGGRIVVGPYVYLIEHDGDALYVGFTAVDVGQRLWSHRETKTPFAMMLRSAFRREAYITARWTRGDLSLERQAIWTIKPRFNVRGVETPKFPLPTVSIVNLQRDPRLGAAVELRASGMTYLEIGRELGVSKQRAHQMLARAAA